MQIKFAKYELKSQKFLKNFIEILTNYKNKLDCMANWVIWDLLWCGNILMLAFQFWTRCECFQML